MGCGEVGCDRHGAWRAGAYSRGHDGGCERMGAGCVHGGGSTQGGQGVASESYKHDEGGMRMRARQAVQART